MIVLEVDLLQCWYVMQEDLYISHSLAKDLLFDGVHFLAEGLLKRWPFSKLREQALRKAMKLIHYEDENTRYMTHANIEKVSIKTLVNHVVKKNK